MSPPEQRNGARRQWIIAGVLICAFWGVILWGVFGITSYFRLTAETKALQTSFIQSAPGTWYKRVGLNVGWFTTSAIRLASSFLDLPPEPRAALRSFHGGDVAIYQGEKALSELDPARLLKSMDQKMQRLGWQRAVGVFTGTELVVVYVPGQPLPGASLRCCALVFHNHELVVTSVRGNLDPLFEMVSRHMPELKQQMPELFPQKVGHTSL